MSLRPEHERHTTEKLANVGFAVLSQMTQLKPAVCQVDLGRPDFIEIKGVTYCGDGGTTSSLTMGNVPYHADVVATGQAICQARQGEHYGRCSPLALELEPALHVGASCLFL